LKSWVKQIQYQLDADLTTWKGKEEDSSSGADHRGVDRAALPYSTSVTQFSPEIRQNFQWITL
jgi:hypothetical protein